MRQNLRSILWNGEYIDRDFRAEQGQITSEGSVREFFTGNAFYTTAARRMTRNILPDCILPEDITRRLGQEDFYA